MARYSEIDAARTVAIILMVIYHTAFDLSVFYGWDINVFDGPWKLLARATAILFLLLVGISAAISQNKKPPISAHIRRFLKIGAAALLVTIATYIANPETYVRFGILHLIAVAAVIVPMLAPLKMWNLLIGIALIVIDPWIPDITFVTVDYFPPIPWLGVILIGYATGYALYVRWIGWRTSFSRNETPPWGVSTEWMTWPGRHSLFCYLIHQPLIIAFLFLLLGKPRF